jgi:hypothetical protein
MFMVAKQLFFDSRFGSGFGFDGTQKSPAHRLYSIFYKINRSAGAGVGAKSIIKNLIHKVFKQGPAFAHPLPAKRCPT